MRPSAGSEDPAYVRPVPAVSLDISLAVLLDQREHVVRIDGLTEARRSLDVARLALGIRVGGHDDDGGFPQRLDRELRLAERAAVHSRHHQIEQDHTRRSRPSRRSASRPSAASSGRYPDKESISPSSSRLSLSSSTTRTVVFTGQCVSGACYPPRVCISR